MEASGRCVGEKDEPGGGIWGLIYKNEGRNQRGGVDVKETHHSFKGGSWNI